MEFLRHVLLFVHFLGLASLLGGFLLQMKGPQRAVNSAIIHGALTQLVTGLLLVGVLEGMDESVNHLKFGLKLLVVLVITVMAFATRKVTSLGNGLFSGMFALSVLNVGIAVFWT